MLKRICYFLHIIDDRGKLDIIDLSFIATMVKIVASPGIDYPSVCAMLPVLLAKMHRTHLRSKTAINSDQQS